MIVIVLISRIDLSKISHDLILYESNYLIKIKIEYFLANNYFVLTQTLKHNNNTNI